MEYQEILNNTKPKLEGIIERLKKEVRNIRTSRPSASLIESIRVDCFGKTMPLKALGFISLGDERSIVIKPWDNSYIEPIEKAIKESVLGFSPIVGKDQIKISFPPLTKGLRERFIRLLSEKAEKAKRSVRQTRNEARKSIESYFSKGEISEDNKFKGREKLQKMIDEFNKEIDKISEEKEKEIMN